MLHSLREIVEHRGVEQGGQLVRLFFSMATCARALDWEESFPEQQLGR